MSAMRRSLKIHIFIHVLIVASLVVFVNRNIAQWLLLDQMKGLLRTSIVTAFEKCEAEIDIKDGQPTHDANGRQSVGHRRGKEKLVKQSHEIMKLSPCHTNPGFSGTGMT